ncbi:hypothetical protein F4815DRAFT_444911 [Daldinia loculata]|nr:hypothetical protein F4815DRAFT_444911 [Daldinia loculata]
MSSATDNEFPSYLKASFPNRFTIPIFNLGAHTHDLRFTVTMDMFCQESPLMVLYDGSTDNGRVLATVDMPKDNQGTYSTTVKVDDTAIIMANHKDDLRHLYRFSLQLESRRERFEWRPTQGNEVCNMFRHAKGFKLVRLKSYGPGNGKGGKRDYRHMDETSDGKEVVAVWATEKNWMPLNLIPTNKPFKFELRASGKSGELGSQFGYFAIATALKVWSYEAQGISGFHIHV